MILNILEYPDPRLKKVAAPVTTFGPEIQRLVRDMAETMYAAPGVGLAATQVDVHKRIIVIDISEARDELRVFINPELLEAEGEAECEEGCLSVPGYYDKVTRAASDSGPRAGRAWQSATSLPRTACSPYASSMKWTIWSARSSSTTCPR